MITGSWTSCCTNLDHFNPSKIFISCYLQQLDRKFCPISFSKNVEWFFFFASETMGNYYFYYTVILWQMTVWLAFSSLIGLHRQALLGIGRNFLNILVQLFRLPGRIYNGRLRVMNRVYELQIENFKCRNDPRTCVCNSFIYLICHSTLSL